MPRALQDYSLRSPNTYLSLSALNEDVLGSCLRWLSDWFNQPETQAPLLTRISCRTDGGRRQRRRPDEARSIDLEDHSRRAGAARARHKCIHEFVPNEHPHLQHIARKKGALINARFCMFWGPLPREDDVCCIAKPGQGFVAARMTN